MADAIYFHKDELDIIWILKRIDPGPEIQIAAGSVTPRSRTEIENEIYRALTKQGYYLEEHEHLFGRIVQLMERKGDYPVAEMIGRGGLFTHAEWAQIARKFNVEQFVNDEESLLAVVNELTNEIQAHFSNVG